MKKILAAFALSFCVQLLSAQSNKALVRKIADQIMKETVMGFGGLKNKQFYTSSAAIPENVKVKYASP